MQRALVCVFEIYSLLCAAYQKRQPVSSTAGYPLLLLGAPGGHLWPHLMGTDGDPSSHMDVHKPQPILADSSAGSTMQFRKTYLHYLALIQNLWNSEDLAYVIAEVDLDHGRFFPCQPMTAGYSLGESEKRECFLELHSYILYLISSKVVVQKFKNLQYFL